MKISQTKYIANWFDWWFARPLLVAFTLTVLGLLATDSNLGIYRASVQFLLADMDSETTGEIVESHCFGDDTCKYFIRYIYIVDATAYRNEVVRYESWDTDVRERLAQYPVGKTVTVTYDSTFPQWSLLVDSDELPWYYYGRWFFNLVFVPIFFYFMCKWAD